MQQRRLTAVWVSVLAALAVAGAWRWSEPGRTAPGPAQAMPPAPLARFLATPGQQFALDRAETDLTNRCMRDRGRTYALPRNGTAPPSVPESPYGLLTVRAARAEGYGIHSPADEPARPANPARTLPRADEDALLGTPAHEELLALPGGGELSVRTDGCAYRARLRLYGDGWPQLRYAVESLANQVVNRVQADAEVRRARRKWADCMAEYGFHGKNPGEARARASDHVARAGRDRAARRRARDQTDELARNDARCQRTGGLLTAVAHAQSAAEKTVVAASRTRLDAYAARRDAALRRAALIGTVRSGSSGGTVRAAQTLLNAHGASSAVDGDFGAGTKSAVVSFQQAGGLAEEGIDGPNTGHALAS
ncbi:peptidoglycan-binding protein [Streptomyces sp. NPDC057499]|uniref:peptidoglycan-binding domain-containing protein n=1 Tax=Streptomyces sp. NPDC057499 TaxID=3346150 RepID=UPI0036C3A27E